MDIENTENSTLISGTDDADYITSTGDNVTVEAGGGNDTVVTEGVSNLIRGDGNNFIAVKGDNSTVITGAGNDSIVNPVGDNVSIDVGDGDNIVVNVGTGTTIISGSGDDQIDNRGSNVKISATGGNNAIVNSGNNVTITSGSGVDAVYSNGANISLDVGGGADYLEINGSENALENIVLNSGAGNDTIDIYDSNSSGVHSGYVSVNGGDGNDVFFDDYFADSTTLLGGAGTDYILLNTSNVLIDGGEGNDFVRLYDNASNTTIIAGSGYDTIQGQNSTTKIIANATGSGFLGSDAIILTDEGAITVVNGKNQTLNLNGNDTIISGNVNTGVDVMTKFFNTMYVYADENYADGLEVLDNAIRAISFYGSLEEAIDAFTYAITDASTYEDTYERLYQTCGIILGADKDYSVDTGAVSGYNAGGDTIKNAQDIVPEPAGAKLSEQEMPEAGVTVAKSFYGNDGTYHTFTITAPENFTTVYNDWEGGGEFDISDRPAALALIEAMAKGMNAWWLEQAAKLAYDSYGLAIDGANITYGFSNSIRYSGLTSPNYDDDSSRSYLDTTPYNEIKILVGFPSFSDMDLDNQNGDNITATGTGSNYLDRVIAHEMIHAVMFKNGVMKNKMPQFFTEGVADLVQGNDDYIGKYTAAIENFATNYSRIYRALEFKSGTGTSDAYSGGYTFLRYLINQALNTEIILGTDAADVYEYYGGDAVVSGYDNSDSISFNTEITGVKLSNGDYFISSGSGTLLLRDAGDKNISLGAASISSENFTVTNKSGSLRVGSEYLNFNEVTANFNLATGEISSLTGALSGFAGDIYTINGENYTVGAADTVIGNGTGATVYSGEVYTDGDSIYGGANVTVSTADFAADTISATVSGNDAILFTSSGNITVLDGATLLGESLDNENNASGIAGTNFDDTLTSTDKEEPLLNGRGGNDLIILNGGTNAQLYGGSGDDTISVTGGSDATIDAGSGDDFIRLSDVESPVIIFSEGSDTIIGGGADVKIIAEEALSVEETGDGVIISGDNGTLTVTDATPVIDYTIFNTLDGATFNLGDGTNNVNNIGGGVEIVLGDGDNSVDNTGGGAEIVLGDGNNTIQNNADNVTVSAGDGGNMLIFYGDNNSIVTGAGDDVIGFEGSNFYANAGAGDDLIGIGEGSSGTIEVGVGNDSIDGYESDVNIVAQVISAKKSGSNVVLTTEDGSIMINEGADKTIIVNGEEFSVPNINTGVDIMKNFFNVLSWYSDDTSTNGVDILSEAVRAVSIYRDLNDAIDNFVYDITQTEGDFETRLLNAANIILNGEDTGAVSGKNAGGPEILNAADIVPEPDVKLSEVDLPVAGSVDNFSVTGNDGTVINFSVKWQDSFTTARDFNNAYEIIELTDQTFTLGDDSITAAEMIEQINLAARGMTLWFPSAVKLAYDSYGVSFDGKTINAYFDVNGPYSAVTSALEDNYQDLAVDTVEIGLDMNQFAGHNIDAENPSGAWNHGNVYIDRFLAHEIIHAVMFGSGTVKNTMPEFFTEGVADLIQGNDDVRSSTIEKLAKSYGELHGAMSLIPGTGGRYTYAAGDMFLRYLINQNLNTEIIFGSDEEDIFEYYGGDAVINNFGENDSVSVNEEIISAVELSNGDKLISTNSGSLMIRGENVSVTDAEGEEINFEPEETVSGSSEINNSENSTEVAGTSGADTISNSGAEVFIDGRGGDDSISSTGDDATIYGGAGNDSISATGENIFVNGGSGDDLISISSENATVETSAGDDTLTGADSNTVVIVNNPVEISDSQIVTEDGTLNVEGEDYSVAYKIVSTVSDTLLSGSSGDDTIRSNGENISIAASAGNDIIEEYNSDVALIGLYDSITSIEFDFTETGLKLTNGDDSILLEYYSGGNLNIDGHKVFAVKEGSSRKIDSDFEYYNVAENATLSGLSAGDSVVVNGATFAANSDGTEITSDGKVVWSGNSEDLGGINIMALQDTGDNTVLAQLVDSVLKVNTETGYPDFAAVFFHASEEADIADATGYASSETLTITSADNLQLSGTHFAPETSTGNWVILVCGYGRTKRTMNPFVETYISQGYDVLSIDPRAMGDSEGEYVTMGVAESHDLALWTQKIAELDSSAKIALHGISEGAATVMLAAADSDTTNVTRIVEDCGYTEIRTVFETLAAGSFLSDTFTSSAVFDTFFDLAEEITGYDVEAAAPIDVISDVTISTLFITGSEDTVATPEMTQALYDACGAETKDIVIVDGAAHGQAASVDSASYTTTIFEFLEDSSTGDSVIIAQDETQTINGVVYTATGGYANLNLDSDGAVTGIESGKVTAQIASAATTPTVTLDATDGAFEFTATVASSALKVSYNDVTIGYAAGAVTYTASGMNVPAGAVSLVTTGSMPMNIALNFESDTSVAFSDGAINAAVENVSGAISLYGTSIGTMAINGGLSFNPSTKEVTFAKDAALDVNISLLNNFSISMTALEEVSGTFEFSTSPMGATFTPSSESGSVQLVTRQGDVTNFAGEINCRAGSMTFGLDGGISLASGTVMDVTVNGMTLTLTASGDEPSKLAIEDGKMAIEPGDGSALGIELNSGTQVLNGNLKLTSGKIIYDPSANEITVESGTVLQIDFGNDYLVTLTATDEAGGTLTLGADGISFAPNSDDGGLALSVTRDGETRTTNLDVTGSLTYKLDGSISLAEGTVVTNTFEDGNILTITAKSDATGSILFDPENGLTITPAEAEALSVLLSSGEIEVFDITSISGSINYKGGVITASDGTSAHFTNYYMDSEMELRTSGGSSSLIITDETTSYIANEGATFVLDYLDGDTLEITSGKFVDDYEHAIITAGSTFRTNDDEDVFVLETAGDYNVNGAEITTTRDGVEVLLSEYNTVSFEADAGISVNGYPVSGSGTISYNSEDGALSLAEGAVLVNTFEDEGIIRTITANAAAENLIHVTDDGITVTSPDPDILTIEITNAEDFEVMTISEIEGTVSYSNDDVLTLSDGAELTISLYGYSAKLSSTGGESSVKIEPESTTYTASEGATFTMDYLDGTVSTLQNGSIIDTYEDYTMTLTEGTTFTANDTEVKYRLESAGTYNLNGAEITTTADGVEVLLSNYDTVEFTANNDVIFNGETLSGDVKIVDGEIYAGEIIAEGESVTIDGIVYTAVDGDAELNVEDEKVTGIESGKVTAQIADAEDSPTITFNATENALNFNLVAEDGALVITITANNGAFSRTIYISEGSVNVESGDFYTSDAVYTFTSSDSGSTYTFTANGLTTTSYTSEFYTISSEDLDVGISNSNYSVALNLQGELNKPLTERYFNITSGTTVAVSIFGYDFNVTADSEDSSFLFANGKFNLSTGEGTVNISADSENNPVFAKEISISGGDVIIDLYNKTFGLTGGTTVEVNLGGDYSVAATATDDASIGFSITEAGLAFTPQTGDGALNLTLSSEKGSMNANIEILGGSLLLGENGAITVEKDTQLQIDFGDGYIVNFKATDDAGGAISFNGDEISFAPNSEDGNLELSVTQNGKTRDTTLNVTGEIIYKLDGTLSLAEGTVIENSWEDGANLKITATTDEVSTVRFTPETGLNIIDEDNNLELELTLPNSAVVNVDSITGTVTYKSATLTLQEGARLHYFYGLDHQIEQIASIDSGTSIVDFSELVVDTETSIIGYTVIENGYGVLKTIDNDKALIYHGGTTKTGTNIQLLEPGIKIYGAAGDSGTGSSTFSLDGDGEYTLNGITVTVSNIDLHDKNHYGTAIRLVDNQSILFTPGTATISYDGNDFTGDNIVSIENTGEITIGNIIAEGESITVDGIVYTAVDGSAMLYLDGDGKVTSIASGKVTLTLEGSDNPSITFEDNSAFTATAVDGAIVFTISGITTTYRSGTVTYDNNKLSVDGGDFTMNGTLYGQAMSADMSAEGTIDFEFSTTGLAIDGEDVALTLTIGETSQNFEISGRFVNNFATRAISLSEGTVIKNISEDVTISTITANTDVEDLLNLSVDGGFSINSPESGAVTIELTNAEDFEVMTISEIEGTINFSDDGVITLEDGTSLDVSVYDYKAKVGTSGNSATFKVEPERIIYTPGEGATLVFDYYEESVVYTEQGGSIIANYESPTALTLTEGINLTTNDETITFVLETAGTYNLNGAEVTTTADGVEVALTNYNTVEFEADSNVIFNGETLSGDIKIVDGEIASIEDNVHVMTENGESFSVGDRTFNMITDAPTGVTVTTGENTFEVAHQITEPEVEAFDDTTEEDLGEIFEEKVTIAGDDSYTVSNRAFGISIVSGLSNGASVNAAVVFDGVENEFGTGFKFVTDEEGTFTFGDKTYTIAGDDNVTLEVSFDADGTAAVENFDGLDENASIMTDGEIINNHDNRTITGDESDDVITNSGENVTINAGDGDNEISNSGDGTRIITGSGDDTVKNTDANDVYINAGAGDNSIVSGCDNVTVISEGGNDTIDADGANTSIVAGDGNNVIYTSNGSATVISGDGNDEITNLNADNVYIDAGNGNNFVGSYLEYTVDAEADTLKNYYENETILTGSGDDTVASYGGYYVSISTGDGNDSIRSHHSYYNTIQTGAGDDEIILQNGHYQNVDAGDGDDTILGNIVSGSGNWAVGGHATLIGGDGDDYINPYYANDSYIEGGDGNDTIISGGPRQTIDAGDGDDLISLSSNVKESRSEKTAENLIITGGGNDTIYGYEETSTIQSGAVENVSVDGKNVILETDEGNITIIDGKNKMLAVNADGELQNFATGEFKIADGETLEANGMTFTGKGKVTLDGESVYLSKGVAVDGANEIILTQKGYNTINGQALWLTEKVPLGVTVATIEDGFSMAHVISEEDFADYAGRIFKEEAYIYGDDEYFVRIDKGGIRSIYGINSGATVEGKGHTETAVGSGEYEDDYSVLILGLAEEGVYTFGEEEYTIGALTSDTPVGLNVYYETDGSTSISRVRYLNGNTIGGDFSYSAESINDDNFSQIISVAEDDSISITGGKKDASVISGVSDGATIYGTGGAVKFTTDEEGEFTAVNYTDENGDPYAQHFTVEGDSSVDFVLGYYTNSLGGASFQIEGIYNFENGNLIFDSTTGYHAINIADNFDDLRPKDVIHFGGDSSPYIDYYVTVQVADSQVVSIDGVTNIDNLKGNVTVHAVGPTTVNGETFNIVGDDDYNIIVADGKVSSLVGISDGATLYSADKVSKFTTDEEGEFYLCNYTGKTQNFTIIGDDSVDFVLEQYTRPDGEAAFQVDGVYNLEYGTLIIDSASAYHAVNVGESVDEIVANKDKVIHFGDDRPEDFWNDYATLQVEDSQLVSIDGVKIIDNLKGDVTVHGIGDMTLNGAQISVAGDDDFNVIVSDGKVASVVGIDDGATIDGASILYQTDGNGEFVLGSKENDTMAITINSSAPVSFGFNRKGYAETISGLNGVMYIDDGIEFNIHLNDTTSSISSAASLFGNGNELVSVAGFENDTTIVSDNEDLIIVLENDSTVTLNKVTFTLTGNEKPVTISGNTVSGLDANAKLTADIAGIYNVNGIALNAEAGDTIIGTKDGSAYIFDNLHAVITDETSNAEMLEYFKAPKTYKRVETDTELTETLIASGEFNGDMSLTLGEVDADFSESSGRKVLTLTDGTQNIKFNDKGNNAVIIGDDVTGVKNIELGSGGDFVIIGDTNAEINIVAGGGDDTIVTSGENVSIDNEKGSAAKIVPLAGNVSVDNYQSSVGAGIQTDYKNIAAAIENSEIEFGSGEVSINGAKVYFNDGYEDSTLVKFYNIQGREQFVGFTDVEGGTLDLSPEGKDVFLRKSAVLVGNRHGISTLIGGLNNDTIYAGGGDYVDGGDGDNQISLAAAADRKIANDGITVAMTTERGATTVTGFNASFDENGDFVDVATENLELEFDGEDLEIKNGHNWLTLKDIGGDSSSADSEDAIGEVSFARVKIGAEGNATNTAVAEKGAVIEYEDNSAQAYYGEKSGVDFASYDHSLSVNLRDSVGSLGNEDLFFSGIDNVRAGSAKTTLIGSAGDNILYAGAGDDSIWGVSGYDTYYGYTGDDKMGSTEFFFDADAVTIEDFKFDDGDLNFRADKINTINKRINNVRLVDEDVVIDIDGDAALTLKDAAGKDFHVQNEFDTVVAQVSDGDLNFDGRADYFRSTGANAAVSVDSALDNVEIWLSNAKAEKFYGDIKTLDASGISGQSTLVGNDADNVITAGSGNSSLWGGVGGNDTMTGGNGSDLFWYESGNGNDFIQGAGANDTVKLFGISLDMLASSEISSSGIKIQMKDGGSVELDTNNGTTFTLGDGSSYVATDGEWKSK